jgi:hypothetical protein
MGKLMEKTLYRQICPALSCHIHDEKFAFLSERDMKLQFLRFAEYITDEFIWPPYTAAVFLDVFNAYDAVWTISTPGP